jgi:pSer/pThr/pTyr-binding forkhead associated (FHA) protein
MMLTPLGDGEPVVIDKAVTFFGRHPDCDVVLTGSRKVSRKHACIAQINDYFVVRDLGSMNGVRINDNEAGTEARLNPGDEVWIGDVGFRFEAGSPKKASPNGKLSPPAAESVRRVPPHLLSQNVPVAIPEESADFVIEETNPKLREQRRTEQKKQARALRKKRSEEIIELSDDDIID